MYRLILYYLIYLLAVALGLCFLHVLHFDPFMLLFSIGFLVAVSGITNTGFARVFNVPANAESAYISALILALIVNPAGLSHDLWFLAWAAVWAMASKYIVAINKKHLFNPVAFAVALTALTINQTATWWVGTASMLPFVIAGGILIVRKTRRFDLVLSFLGSAVLTVLAFSVLNRENPFSALVQTIINSPFLFFGFVILTEPLTTPPTRQLQVYYGLLVGFLFAPQFHLGAFYTTPELAILIGNVFSYIVSPKVRLILQLKQKIQVAPDVYDFIFVPNRQLAFAPGQYMEWTLGHKDPDSRGNRRYFTLSSSPTENHLRLGVKFYPNSSSFKHSMLAMDAGSEIVAAQLAGDFTLPQNRHQECVFIAGGIGITPFRSMIKYLLDTNQRRPITLLYSNRTADEIVYRDILDQAQRKLGIKVVYTLTDTRRVHPSWNGCVGHIDEQMIRQMAPNCRDCLFYISGPTNMVNSVRGTLLRLGVNKGHIKTDFFPGLA
jgi:ferredoxin-NADP reductase